MSEVKPVAGQWYAEGDSRFYCVGIATGGWIVFQCSNGYIFAYHEDDAKKLKHLPDCTGWDWEPETFPQYWSAAPKNAYVLRRSSAKGDCVVVGKDGKQSQWLWLDDDSSTRKRLTESEALALLDKPQQAEDPEEWVDLPKDHRIRAEIDWYDYGGVFDYVCKGSTLIGVRVGDTQAKKARCRRKDMPKPKRTVTVPKWLCRSWGNWQVLECSKPIGFEEVHRVGETTYTEQEDGTWIES